MEQINRYGFLVLCYLLLLINFRSEAQDAHFSQFYSAPTFLSPSLAGSTGGTRFVTNYRNQWPGISKTYQTFAVSADMYFSKYRSGFGALIVTDKAGSANLNTTYLGLQYSYRVPIGDNWQFIPGLQFTLGQKSLDRSKLQFPDDVVTGTPSGGNIYLTDTRAQYIDFCTSLFLYSQKFWVGTVFDHMLRPNYSFLGSKATLPFKFVNFGGMNLWQSRGSRLEVPRSASLCYRFETQNGYKQLDLGAYWYGRVLDFGVWYRGFPVFKNNNTKNHFIDNDAVVFSIGVVNGSYRIGYSYDIQLSQLATFGAGAHEISIIVELGELFGCGLKYLDCYARRNTIQFNRSRPRNMKVQ